jgi:SET domain-containing protein
VQIVKSIRDDSYVCLKPSKVCDGVGVFALRPIPAQTLLFSDVQPDVDFIEWAELEGVHPNILTYLASICNADNGGIYLSRTINSINVSYYVNHSDTPNILHNKVEDKFVTLRSIEEGEELLCKYEVDEMDWIK